MIGTWLLWDAHWSVLFGSVPLMASSLKVGSPNAWVLIIL